MTFLVTPALQAQTPGVALESPAAEPSTQPADSGWEAIDQRFVFLTVELSSVEASLKAVNRALVAAGRDQASAKQRAANYADGNARMDRQGGGPMTWQDFYGKTAKDFYYHSTGSVRAEGQSNFHMDAQFQGSELTPLDRPPHFDYIYRANSDAEERANADAANIGTQIDRLLARRRELESEQSALWFKIALRGVTSQSLNDKALYRDQLQVARSDRISQARFTAVAAGCDFMRTVNLLVKQAQPALDDDQDAVYKQLLVAMDSSCDTLRRTLLSISLLADQLTDLNSNLGRFNAASKRLDDLAQNIVDARHLAMDGDTAGDDIRKEDFRGQLQQAAIEFASTIPVADKSLSALASEWNIAPDLSRPHAVDSKQLIVLAATRAATAPAPDALLPQRREVASKTPPPETTTDGPAIAAERNRIDSLKTRPLRGAVTDDDITISESDKPYAISGTYLPMRSDDEQLHITVKPGVEIRGGHLALEVDSGTKKYSLLYLNGTRDRPIIMRNVEIGQPLTSLVKADYVIFDHCTFQKTGPWFAEHSSKWQMQHCLLYNCTFPRLDQLNYGFNMVDCTLVGMTFPEIDHVDADKPFDYMTLLRKEWTTIKVCTFVDCTVPPTVFWCAENSNYFGCTFPPGPAFSSDSPTRVFAYVNGTDGESPDEINRDNPPVRAALTVRFRDTPFLVSRWPADCPVPEIRYDSHLAAAILSARGN